MLTTAVSAMLTASEGKRGLPRTLLCPQKTADEQALITGLSVYLNRGTDIAQTNFSTETI